MEPTKEPVIDLVSTFALDGDNLFTAARRIVRFIRGDDEHHGGLLSRDTIQANETLAIHVAVMERVIKHVQAQRTVRKVSSKSDKNPAGDG